MNSWALCVLLGKTIPPGRSRKPVAVVLTERDTGEVLEFPTIASSARYLGVFTASVAYRLKIHIPIVGTTGRVFMVSRG